MVKARSAIAERWKQTEAVLDLLRELDNDLEQAWAARMFACSALIRERLNIQMIGQRIVADSMNPDEKSTSTIGSQSDANRPRSSRPILSGSGLSPASASSNKQNDSSSQLTLELLHSNTYIDSLTASEDLDQLLSLFRGNRKFIGLKYVFRYIDLA